MEVTLVELTLIRGIEITVILSHLAVGLHQCIGLDNLIICAGYIGQVTQIQGRENLLLGIVDYVGCLTLLESL